MHLGDRHFDVVLVPLLELVEIGLVKEKIAVQAFFIDLHCRLHVVREDFYLEIHPLPGKLRLDEFQDFRVRDRRGGDRELVCSVGGKRLDEAQG